MVQCAALNCTVKSGQGISMYLFPNEPKLRREWTLKMKRDGFEPSQYSKICESHFEKSQFAVDHDVAAAVGFKAKTKMLITGAIPTIFDHTDPKSKSKHGKRVATADPDIPTPQRKSKALEKRKRIEVNKKYAYQLLSF